MQKACISRALFFALLILSPTSLNALCREYWNEESRYSCALHFDDTRVDEDIEQYSKDLQIDQSLLTLIPAIGPKCDDCSEPSIYSGYLDRDSRKHIANLEKELCRLRDHPKCTCYWPERSEEAAQINNEAYQLFHDLVSTTALSGFLFEPCEQRRFLNVDRGDLNIHGVTVSLIAVQFRFSDYYDLCEEIDEYAKVQLQHYRIVTYCKVREKLDTILDTLYSRFFALYTHCMELHPSQEIAEELRFMKLLVGDESALDDGWQQSPDRTQDSPSLQPLKTKSARPKAKNHSLQTSRNAKRKVIPNSLSPKTLIMCGALLNDSLRYQEGIALLSEAIKVYPSKKEAYLERARAYFETGQINQALQDYKKYKTLSELPFLKGFSQNDLLFQGKPKGVLSFWYTDQELEFLEEMEEGILEGAEEAIAELLPSVLNSCKGMGMGLWAAATQPKEVVREVSGAAYLFGKYCSDHWDDDWFEYCHEELAELAESWENLDNAQRGHLLGHFIGKYGIESLAPLAPLKLASKARAFKRANTALTLERCAVSETKKAKVLEQSAKICTGGDKLLQAAKAGKIVPRNPNVIPHFLRPKKHDHAWNRLTKLSGNDEKDFKAIIEILEKNGVFKKECMVREELYNGKVKRIYEKTINDQKIRLNFVKDDASGAFLLEDGWVAIR